MFFEVSRVLMLARFTLAASSFSKIPGNCSFSPEMKKVPAFEGSINAKSEKCPVKPISFDEEKYKTLLSFVSIKAISLKLNKCKFGVEGGWFIFNYRVALLLKAGFACCATQFLWEIKNSPINAEKTFGGASIEKLEKLSTKNATAITNQIFPISRCP